MAALAAPRPTPKRNGDRFSRSVAAGETVYQGALVALSATGFAIAAATAADITADGMAVETADNADGADGDRTVTVERGVFQFANSAGADEIGAADIGATAYIVDDQTVALTDGGGTRSAAGKIEDVDALGVWVAIG